MADVAHGRPLLFKLNHYGIPSVNANDLSGLISPRRLDPLKLTGHIYSILFSIWRTETSSEDLNS